MKLTREDIVKYLVELNRRLQQNSVKGDIAIFGGAVMILSFNSRSGTRDIDAVFEPKTTIRSISEDIAYEYNLPYDWLNDGVKGFMSENSSLVPFDKMSNLTIYVAAPDYMLAMKVLASRTDSSEDIKDIKFLLGYLNIKTVDEAFKITTKYYSLKRIPAKAYYILDDLLGG